MTVATVVLVDFIVHSINLISSGNEHIVLATKLTLVSCIKISYLQLQEGDSKAARYYAEVRSFLTATHLHWYLSKILRVTRIHSLRQGHVIKHPVD